MMQQLFVRVLLLHFIQPLQPMNNKRPPLTFPHFPITDCFVLLSFLPVPCLSSCLFLSAPLLLLLLFPAHSLSHSTPSFHSFSMLVLFSSSYLLLILLFLPNYSHSLDFRPQLSKSTPSSPLPTSNPYLQFTRSPPPTAAPQFLPSFGNFRWNAAPDSSFVPSFPLAAMSTFFPNANPTASSSPKTPSPSTTSASTSKVSLIIL